MIILEGKNLCERQKYLNFKVNEAAKSKVDLQTIKPEENSDIDMVFKIDLASKYQNAEYIIEELKSGDSLYVSRALKCEWLYNSEHSHIINPDYLHHHIFPMMSLKMKRKMLSAISNHLKDEARAQLFYEYCMNTNMADHAYKFLIFTSESFKEEFMNDDDKFYKLYREMNNFKYFNNLIGNSFNLADIYGKKRISIKNLSYLYSVNNVNYLDLFEKHTKTPYCDVHVGIKLSRSILKKHKDRILRNPPLYLSILNEKELVKYSTSEDALVYVTALLPDDVKDFWNMNFYSKYKHIFKIIKLQESMYKFVKNLFNAKYPEADFEMSRKFYEFGYYDLMTFEERESWAINHLEKQTGVIPESEDYKWYEFITFDKTFAEIKKRILITSDQYKRSELLKVLEKSTKTQKDLKELLDYYYNRHINEQKERKESFLQGIIKHHKVFEFEENCWDALHKIFHSLELYTSSRPKQEFLVVSLIYHIINEKSLPKGLIVESIDIYSWSPLRQYLDQLNEVKRDLVYKFLIQFTITKLSEFNTLVYNQDIKKKVRQYLYKLTEYMKIFKKEEKYPDIVIKYMKLDWKQFGYIFQDQSKKVIEITEGYLIRCLKEDASLILEKLPLIKNKCDNSREFRINLLLKKMKMYFQNDIAKHYLDFCLQTLNNTEVNNLLATVYAIFLLGDKQIKSDIMEKYAPTNPKIEHDKIDRHVYYVQEAICRMHCYSRPPMPLTKTALYIKGDYVHKCNEVFNMYLANLPPALLTDFIQILLDAPLSIQKRGLRLAFQTFESADLKNLVSRAWKKTKNVSLRNILYKLLLDKVVKEKEKTQDLFKLLIELTVTIHDDDDDGIFDCFNGYQLPTKLRGPYLQTAWETVAALSVKKSANNKRKTLVMKALTSNITLLDEGYLVTIITSHVHELLSDQKLRPESNSGIVELNVAKWDLVAQYIVENANEAELEKSLNVLKSIVDECFNHWNVEHETGEYVYQSFFKGFVASLDNKTSYFGTQCLRVVQVYEYLLKRFENNFDISEMYSYLWDFKLAILTRTVIDGKSQLNKEACISFGLQLGMLVTELKDSNRFYTYFIGKILEKISRFIQSLTFERDRALTVEDLSILIAYGLTLTANNETFILALEILPVDLSLRPAIQFELPQIFKKIKEQNDKELIAFMKDKFIYSDQKVRKLLQ